MTCLNGHWKLESNGENWEEYMKAMGVNIVLRKVANNLTIYEELKQEGEEWVLNLTSTFKNQYLRFRLGEEFPESTADGRKPMSTLTVEDNKLVHKQRAVKKNEIDSTIIRELIDSETMHLTAIAHCANGTDVTCVRVFKRYTP
ncbi:LOW QUALITY PROTEIN: sodium/calcium exchanger regulatory protein 1-like [Liolophura sinensis]|uniref:LOW QUALITY PROTEIN: sodium/calcium exchanger regulatory protein 1-like n=1 Tax=Liolophura sinensis TaxID=3198878 RepID=UPI0031592E3D